MKQYAKLGSVSHGTMREEDLIPTFLDVLQGLAEANGSQDHLIELGGIKDRSEYRSYYESEDASYDLWEIITPMLEEYAPPFTYFGANPGDGSDYGFWLSEDIEQELQEAEGEGEVTRITDLAQVPQYADGYVLLVNDHGNMTLYKQKITLEEIWTTI